MPIRPEVITLRPATPDDVDFAVHVAEVCIRPYAEQAFGTWDSDLVRARFDPSTCSLVLVVDQSAGTMDAVEYPDHIQLNVLYILPQFRDHGVGGTLLQRLIARANVAAKPLRLRVLRVNPARRFYERHGFIVYDEGSERFFMERRVAAINL